MEIFDYSEYHHSIVAFNELLGKTFTKIYVCPEKEFVSFKTSDGIIYTLFHEQDCCESVYLNDVVGDLDNLLDSEILIATEESNQQESEPPYESETWTFYKLATIKGYVDLRWCGTSNGYYSERVSLCKTIPETKL